jgi:uncharacterized OB-fold protein
MTRITEATAPHPSPTADWQRAFCGHLAQRELRIARCRKSGLILDFPELARAGRTTKDIAWIPASGRARLYSFVVYRRQYHPDFVPPYNVAAVVLEEGPLLISTVIAEPEQLVINMPLTAAFDAADRLVFQPSRIS